MAMAQAVQAHQDKVIMVVVPTASQAQVVAVQLAAGVAIVVQQEAQAAQAQHHLIQGLQ
jgi:hypothetical protein